MDELQSLLYGIMNDKGKGVVNEDSVAMGVNQSLGGKGILPTVRELVNQKQGSSLAGIN